MLLIYRDGNRIRSRYNVHVAGVIGCRNFKQLQFPVIFLTTDVKRFETNAVFKLIFLNGNFNLLLNILIFTSYSNLCLRFGIPTSFDSKSSNLMKSR